VRDPRSSQAALCSAPSQGLKQALPLQWLQMLRAQVLQCVGGLQGAERQQHGRGRRATLVARGGAEEGAQRRCCVRRMWWHECVRAGAASHVWSKPSARRKVSEHGASREQKPSRREAPQMGGGRLPVRVRGVRTVPCDTVTCCACAPPLV